MLPAIFIIILPVGERKKSLRADKAPKKAMFAVIFSGFLNIVLDYVFVFPLNMGMKGAAIATVFSYTISCLILLTHLLSKNNTLIFKKDFYEIANIIRIIKLRNLGLCTSLVIGFSSFILCITFPEQIVRIFVKPSNEVLAIAINSIKIYSTAFIIMGINMVIGAYFQSIELAKESFIIAFCRELLFVSICVFMLPLFVGINGVWLSVPIGELLTLIVVFVLQKLPQE